MSSLPLPEGESTENELMFRMKTNGGHSEFEVPKHLTHLLYFIPVNIFNIKDRKGDLSEDDVDGVFREKLEKNNGEYMKKIMKESMGTYPRNIELLINDLIELGKIKTLRTTTEPKRSFEENILANLLREMEKTLKYNHNRSDFYKENKKKIIAGVISAVERYDFDKEKLRNVFEKIKTKKDLRMLLSERIDVITEVKDLSVLGNFRETKDSTYDDDPALFITTPRPSSRTIMSLAGADEISDEREDVSIGIFHAHRYKIPGTDEVSPTELGKRYQRLPHALSALISSFYGEGPGSPGIFSVANTIFLGPLRLVLFVTSPIREALSKAVRRTLTGLESTLSKIADFLRTTRS